MRALWAPAAIYSRGTYRPTTIDVLMFHFRVRNGTGWGHQAVTTGLQRALACGLSLCIRLSRAELGVWNVLSGFPSVRDKGVREN